MNYYLLLASHLQVVLVGQTFVWIKICVVQHEEENDILNDFCQCLGVHLHKGFQRL